jgi:hypothetical protein
VNCGSVLDRDPRILPDSLHHGEEAVRALRRQVLLEMKAAEHGIGVDVENSIRGFT